MLKLREQLDKFFWAMVSNCETDVSTGAVLAILVVCAWTFNVIWATVYNTSVKVGPAELSALAFALMGVPKVAAYLGKKGDNANQG